MRYAHSDGDRFYGTFDSVKEAVFAHLDMFPGQHMIGDTIEVCECIEVPMPSTVCATAIIDMLNAAAFEAVGDAAEDWPSCTNAVVADLDARLDKEIAKWLEDHKLTRTFFTAQNRRDVELTEYYYALYKEKKHAEKADNADEPMTKHREKKC